MKKITLIGFLVTFSISLFAQDLPIDPDTKKVTYWAVVEVPGATKTDLFKRAETFGTVEKENILKDDAASGVYSTKGTISVTYPSPMRGLNHSGTVGYTLTLFVKDGKYKYVITDLMHESVKGSGGELSKTIPACGKYTLIPAGWATIKKSTDEQVKKLIEGIKDGMRNPSKNSATSNQW